MSELLAGFPIVYEQPVVWGDLDAHAHVSNVRYFRYMENARVAYYRRIGKYEVEEATGVTLLVAETRCRFLKPVSFPDTVRTGASVAESAGTTRRCSSGWSARPSTPSPPRGTRPSLPMISPSGGRQPSPTTSAGPSKTWRAPAVAERPSLLFAYAVTNRVPVRCCSSPVFPIVRGVQAQEVGRGSRRPGLDMALFRCVEESEETPDLGIADQQTEIVLGHL